MADRTVSCLGYGELLVAESLAAATGKPLPELIAQKQKSQSWAQVAKQNKINPVSLTGRLRTATESMHIAERNYNQQRSMNLNLRYNSQRSGMPAEIEKRGYKGFSSTTWRQPMNPMSVQPKTPHKK